MAVLFSFSFSKPSYVIFIQEYFDLTLLQCSIGIFKAYICSWRKQLKGSMNASWIHEIGCGVVVRKSGMLTKTLQLSLMILHVLTKTVESLMHKR